MDAVDYFEVVAAMLGIYAIIRVTIWLQDRIDFRPPQSESSNCEAHSIDTSQLAQRMEEVRRDYVAEAHAHPPSSKQPLLVEQRRAEIAKLAFFQKPPEPGQSEQEHGLPVLLAL
jgi:hypothetical protein